MSGFTKLFSSILGSSLWQEDDATRLVWIAILALADQHGEVNASVPGLAHHARVSLDACQAALAKLPAPDPFSRTPDNDGRRIEPIPGGWFVLNYQKYMEMMGEENRREQSAIRMRRHRARKNGYADSVTVTQCYAESVTERNGAQHSVTSDACYDKQKQKQKQKQSRDKDVGETRAAVAAPTYCDDPEWLMGIAADPAYTGIDVQTERAKMVRWCEVNRKQPTRRRFVNWLNRIDRPMAGQPNLPLAQPQTLPMWKQLEIVEGEIKQLTNGARDAMGTLLRPLTDQQRARLTALKARRDEIKKAGTGV